MVYTETYTVVYIHVFFGIKLVCCLGIVWIRATRQTQSWYITWYILCYIAWYISCYLAWYISCYMAWYTPNHTLTASSTVIPGTLPGVGIGRSRNNAAISAASSPGKPSQSSARGSLLPAPSPPPAPPAGGA